MSHQTLNFQLDFETLATQESDVIIAGVFEEALTPEAETLNTALNGLLLTLKENGDLNGKSNTLLPLYTPQGIKAKRILLVGLGKKDKFGLKNLKKAVGAATQWLKNSQIKTATFALLESCGKRSISLPTLMHALGSALYSYDAYKSKKTPSLSLTKVVISLTNECDDCHNALAYGEALINGMNFTKDLGNAPGNVIYPETLAEEALKLGKAFPAITVKVLEKPVLEELGMGALLGVAQGGKPPRLIVLEYNNQGREKPLALVGKGVTFDTGGISLKPSAQMDEMKFDMCGAASVLGTFRAVAELNLPVNLVGVIAAVENMPSGESCKPGDILHSMAGITIENLNTDAEGRLILCDALHYATQYEPEAIVNMATLTGAMIIALGHDVSGLFSNNDTLAKSIEESSMKVDDRVWRFPIWEDTYQDLLDSNFADMANISSGRGAGSITAACFLSRFVKDIPWAHLDIAGTAWLSGKEKGATARPVPLLLDFVKKYQA